MELDTSCEPVAVSDFTLSMELEVTMASSTKTAKEIEPKVVCGRVVSHVMPYRIRLLHVYWMTGIGFEGLKGQVWVQPAWAMLYSQLKS